LGRDAKSTTHIMVKVTAYPKFHSTGYMADGIPDLQIPTLKKRRVPREECTVPNGPRESGPYLSVLYLENEVG
jgi:hypothetical protein